MINISSFSNKFSFTKLQILASMFNRPKNKI